MAQDRRRRFELLALPHLDAAYNLARWLAGNAVDADDVVQEAYLRAFRYFDSFSGADMRVWLLGIVRNTFLSWVRENRSARLVFPGEEQMPEAADAEEAMWGDPAKDPETLLLRAADAALLDRLVEALPAEYREVLVLREIEDMPYRDIAAVTDVPIGTVMSRLSRARARLRRAWRDAAAKETGRGM